MGGLKAVFGIGTILRKEGSGVLKAFIEQSINGSSWHDVVAAGRVITGNLGDSKPFDSETNLVSGVLGRIRLNVDAGEVEVRISVNTYSR